MRFLYLIFIASMAALLLAAYAVARTIRRDGRPRPSLTLRPGEKDEHQDAEADVTIDDDRPRIP